MSRISKAAGASFIAAGALAAGLGFAASGPATAESSGASTRVEAVGASCDMTSYRSPRLVNACQWAAGGAGIIVGKDGDGGKGENGPVMAP